MKAWTLLVGIASIGVIYHQLALNTAHYSQAGTWQVYEFMGVAAAAGSAAVSTAAVGADQYCTKNKFHRLWCSTLHPRRGSLLCAALGFFICSLGTRDTREAFAELAGFPVTATNTTSQPHSEDIYSGSGTSFAQVRGCLRCAGCHEPPPAVVELAQARWHGPGWANTALRASHSSARN